MFESYIPVLPLEATGRVGQDPLLGATNAHKFPMLCTNRHRTGKIHNCIACKTPIHGNKGA